MTLWLSFCQYFSFSAVGQKPESWNIILQVSDEDESSSVWQKLILQCIYWALQQHSSHQNCVDYYCTV